MKWLIFGASAVILLTLAVAEGEIWKETEHEVLIRSERGAKNRDIPISTTWCGTARLNQRRKSRRRRLVFGNLWPVRNYSSGHDQPKQEECRYAKGAWSECDSKTNQRSRTLTLKKGNATSCEPTKTVQKKCKKACRYEKGNWAECNAQGQMTRSDKLKPGSDASCEQSRQMTKKCKAKGGVKPTKGTRRNRQ